MGVGGVWGSLTGGDSLTGSGARLTVVCSWGFDGGSAVLGAGCCCVVRRVVLGKGSFEGATRVAGRGAF